MRTAITLENQWQIDGEDDCYVVTVSNDTVSRAQFVDSDEVAAFLLDNAETKVSLGDLLRFYLEHHTVNPTKKIR